MFACGTAHAVVVHGRVTDPQGRPVSFARVQLIQGGRSVAFALSGPDGTYEMRSSASGRFVLVTTSARLAPGIGESFYGGRTAVVTRDISLDPTAIQPAQPLLQSGLAGPMARVTGSSAYVAHDDLRTRLDLLDDLRLTSGATISQIGQTGSPAGLMLRGGDAQANAVLIDGVRAEDVGGGFDLGSLGSTAMATTEVYRGANTARFGGGAEAGAVSLATTRGNSAGPAFDYSGDGGNLNTWRDEAILSGTRQRLDYLAGYARLDTSNALLLDRFHTSTSVANLGYAILTNTLLRFTLRNADSASGMPGAYDLYNLVQAGRLGEQNLVSGVTVENTLGGNWHTVARYGVSRRREELFHFYPVGLPVATAGGTRYYGNPVTLRGANGYVATGRAAFDYAGPYPGRQDTDSSRDELSIQTDYALNRHAAVLLGARYANERGLAIQPVTLARVPLLRVNFGYTISLQGDIVRRVFYSVAGGLEKNHFAGIMGAPRVGLAYTPVRPGGRWVRGTKIHGDAATGFREPSLQEEVSSLYGLLTPAASARYGVTPVTAPRSRTFELGVDQNIFLEKLIVRASYFHNQFAHQFDTVDTGSLQGLFGIATVRPATANTLDYRAQGIETAVEYQPTHRLFLHGGYTWMPSTVERSFASNALAANGATTNPNLPGIPIGASSPLVGARPFEQPRHTGFFAVQYTGKAFTAAFQGALASRADDSTFAAFRDANSGNAMLLPNRDLDGGYAKLDANFTYVAGRHVTIFTQFENLLDQQHMAPVGYVSVPFTVRSGLKIHIGGR
ncbi:TonB-dependent receptor [Granulicella rosea]|uniref:TonB-dependent receptor n=1 Tax=Granulicella rosea TaxID=474952 RepID=UPI001FE98324|nr:TonB-dependent receptor [Granulicella rosea]